MVINMVVGSYNYLYEQESKRPFFLSVLAGELIVNLQL